MARPQKELDPDLVQSLANAQLTNVEIAQICHCEEKTLTRRFGDALKAWKTEGVGSVRRKLFVTAMSQDKGAVTAMIFFLKNYGGMSDYQKTGDDNRTLGLTGVPIPAEFRESGTAGSHKPN